MSQHEIDQALNAVIETIDTAHKYRMQLAELLSALNEGKEQVKTTAEKSRTDIRQNFECLKHYILEALDDRLQELINEVDTIENTTLNPLVQCEDLIQQGVDKASLVMSKGKELLTGDHNANQGNMKQFSQESNKLQLNSLPEVPHLADVAAISVDFSVGVREVISTKISGFGKIYPKAPVQITEILERPGALLVKWAEVDDDNAPDIVEFELQYCYANQTTAGNQDALFSTIFQGNHQSHLVRGLKTLVPYTFRIRCLDDEKHWSPWGVPQVGVTSLPHHEWSKSTDAYTLSNENRTVCLESTSDSPLPVLYSTAASFVCSHSIVFHILEMGEEPESNCIGLSASSEECDSLLRPGALVVDMSGQVFIDGKKMTTKLPNVKRGSSLLFETEELQTNKIRVSIETEDRQVTFDWKIDSAQSPVSPVSPMMMMMGGPQTSNMYLGIQLTSSGWKVAVE